MTIIDLIKLAKENDVLVEIKILIDDRTVCTSLISIDKERKERTFAQNFMMTFEQIEMAKFDVYSCKFRKAIKIVSDLR